jgi:hypothetical protein
MWFYFCFIFMDVRIVITNFYTPCNVYTYACSFKKHGNLALKFYHHEYYDCDDRPHTACHILSSFIHTSEYYSCNYHLEILMLLCHLWSYKFLTG